MGDLRLALAHGYAHAGLSTNPPSVYSYGAPWVRSTRKGIIFHIHAAVKGEHDVNRGPHTGMPQERLLIRNEIPLNPNISSD